MALIDVSELLGDPDFSDAFVIIRQDAAVNAYGENELTETQINVVGVVQPASPDTLARLPDSVRSQDAITVWYQGLLKSSAGGDTYPDVVVWGGYNFVVHSTDPFNNYGAGYVQAVCVRLDATDAVAA